MLTASEFPKTLLAGIKAEFEVGRQQYAPKASPFVQTVGTNLETTTYALYGAQRGPQVFTGEVRYGKLKEYSMSVKNIEYYDALQIEYRLLKYAQTDMINQKARSFGYEWDRGLDKLATQTLAYGASTTCYDGTPYFGASHVDMDSGVQSNIATGASSLDSVTFRVAANAMANFKDDRGEIMGRKITHVLVGTGTVDHVNALQLANSTYTTATTSFAANPWAGSFEVIDTPYLPSAVKFVALDLSTSNRPVIRQEAGERMFLPQERDSEYFQTYKAYRYAVHQDLAFALQDWRYGYMQI